ncbi:Hypothetical protein NGAL_HAMBI2605_09470 [Neorhizobium galegae bv. orientalis]|nr:Hypothetical protein NGAL_HAMBI2605_09470 [Neorhizobium galegae bv. orientalis]
MANKEISELTAASTLTGAELVHITQGGNSRRTTVDGIVDGAFRTTATWSDVQVASASFKMFNAAGTPRALSHDTTALTADRVATWPDAPINFSLMSQLGMGQTWQQFTTTANVGRQNTTGKPIMVFSQYGGGSTATFSVSSDGVTYNAIYAHSGSDRASTSAIIPSGQFYRFNVAQPVWELI